MLIPVLKSKTFAYVLVAGGIFLAFTQWQGKREATKQLEEKTKQLKTIMENPVERIVEGPVKIIEGKTIVKTVVKEVKVDGTATETTTETITEPTITEKGPTIKEKDYVDPIGLADKKALRYTVFGQYFIDQTFGAGLTAQFPLGLNIGPNMLYNSKDKNVNVGLVVLVRF